MSLIILQHSVNIPWHVFLFPRPQRLNREGVTITILTLSTNSVFSFPKKRLSISEKTVSTDYVVVNIYESHFNDQDEDTSSRTLLETRIQGIKKYKKNVDVVRCKLL